MEKQTFTENEVYFPVTMIQFESLVNEMLEKINVICAPNFLNSDYMAQIVMSAIHAVDHKHGILNKSEIFESCVNRISCHITYHAVEEIQKRLKEADKAKEGSDPALSVVPEEIEH